ncbi:MAG TPA: ribosomal biogenesis protein [Thermoplasmata archaeon]|nr:ribosomal biogenesis protein [Thermoplasmata archaeon]
MLLVTTWFGSFLLDEGKVVQQKLFPKDAAEIASRLALIEDWKALDEEKEFLSLHDDLFVVEPRLERAGGNLTGERPPFLAPDAFGYDRELLHASMVELAKRRMRKAIRPEDHLRQAVGGLDELIEQENLLVERVREWYGLHFPELARMVDTGTYTQMIATHGRRENLPMEYPESVGADLGPREEAEVRALAELTRQVAARRKAIEGYVESSVRGLAPNVSALVGPMIAARLVTLAGGVEELARSPAGTIQLLGAERALFRHLRTGSRPPKHGVLFQHPWVHRAPRWQRGAIARAFAGTIAIAARADAYTHRDLAGGLLRHLEETIDGIRTRKAEKPARHKGGRTPPARRREGRRRR